MRLDAAEASGVAATAPGLWRCASCQSVTMTILPTQEQLNSFYSHYHATDNFVRKAPKKVMRALKRLLPFRVFGGAGRFLEVGGSIGTAAEAARRLGYEPHVQEIDSSAVAEGRKLYPNITFHEGFIEDVPKGTGFDMIYAAEVIEHVIDPHAFALEMLERLKPGGRLFVTTPDAGHPKRPEPFIRWGSVKPPEHITLFTQQGITHLLENAGFTAVRCYPHPKPGIRLTAKRAR